MSFQAYLDNIRAKTGKTPDDFKKLAEKKGLLKPDVKAGEIVNWLKKDFDLGHGHAMAVYAVFKSHKKAEPDSEDAIALHFGSGKTQWRVVFDKLMKKLRSFGEDVHVLPAKSYLSILRGDKKFAIIQVSKDRLDIGIKLPGVAAGKRLEDAGSWNAMVTHRVRLENPEQLDKELTGWMEKAYERNSK